MLDGLRGEIFVPFGQIWASYLGKEVKTVRIQIENLLNSDDYCRKIKFHRVLDKEGNPIEIMFTKDDFRGFFIIKFGYVKSSVFNQDDIENFFISAPDGGGLGFFRLRDKFYQEDLIEKLRAKGINVDEEDLIGITRQVHTNRIVYLQKGTSAREWIHIILEHQKDFEEKFQISDELKIAILIFNTLTDEDLPEPIVVDVFKTKEYIYQVGRDKLHIIVDDDGWIINAYPELW